MDGLIRVDKPAGWTSHDAVAYIKRALGVRKAGHTGTLDPAATGLLLVLVGRATRLARYFEHDSKTYLATLSLGSETDTQDAEGEVINTCAVPELEPGDIKAALLRFTGDIIQIPPMYSAVKVGGKPLYAHARQGREVERRPRNVTIHEISLAGLAGRSVSLAVSCSKGTYVRTLCRDIAEALRSCGHLESLRRTGSGGYAVDGAVELASRPSGDELSRSVIGIESMLDMLPAAVVKAEAAAGVLNGRPPASGDLESLPEGIDSGGPCRIIGMDGRLLAVARAAGYGGVGGVSFRLEVVLN